MNQISKVSFGEIRGIWEKSTNLCLKLVKIGENPVNSIWIWNIWLWAIYYVFSLFIDRFWQMRAQNDQKKILYSKQFTFLKSNWKNVHACKRKTSISWGGIRMCARTWIFTNLFIWEKYYQWHILPIILRPSLLKSDNK